MKKVVLCLLVFFGFSNTSRAQDFVIADIIVDGYQRISPGIIYNLLPVGIGDEVPATAPAQIIRELSQSEYFDEIEVSREGNILVITVLERPSVAEIEIEGNSQQLTIGEEFFPPANAMHTVRNVGKTNNVWYYGYKNT